jgi:MOSC domain-containing protein YiiM
MAQLVSIVYTPRHDYQEPPDYYLRVPVSTAELVAGHGIKGDRKGSNPKRGLNVMSAETQAGLAQEGFKTAPGQLGEQLVISGLDFAGLTPGACLQIGAEATIEYLDNRIPCERFEHIQGRPRQTATDRVGFMARVLTGGRIKVGDPVSLLEPVPAA